MERFDRIYADYTFAPLVRGGIALARYFVGADGTNASPPATTRAPKADTAA